MKKSGANDNRNGRRICLALAAVLAFGNTSSAAAGGNGRWPRATYYTVIARAGDTASIIAGRYRAEPSVVIKLNGLKVTGQVAAGRILLIPAITRATRDAVLAEAMDRSAPDYATRPGSRLIAPSAVSAPSEAVASPRTHVALGGQEADLGQPKSLRFAWPIAGAVISSFGAGVHGTWNEGINIATERGAPFRAAAGGTVSYAGPLRGYGNLILITHSHSYITAYAHADNIAVAAGEVVAKGQVIGTAGTTGGVDQPQLHFEIRRGTTPIDPNRLLAANS